MTMTPEIGPTLAIALCMDNHTGSKALDNPMWQGADEDARCSEWGEWAFCFSPSSLRMSAQHVDGHAAIWNPGYGICWEAI